jgi:hypothetical protein
VNSSAGGRKTEGFSMVEGSGSVAVVALSFLAINAALAQEQPATKTRNASEMQPFLGTWQIDQSRTKLGAITTSYEQEGDKIRVTTPRGTYTFKIDGTEYPTMTPGATITWRQVDKNSFEVTSKRNGKIEFVSTRVLSPDGKTINVTTKLLGEKPTTVTSKMERLTPPSAGNPLIGTWKNARERSYLQNARLTYTPVGDGLHVKYEGPNRQEYTLVFDGKEHPAEGGANDALAALKINERSYEEKWTRNGKLATTATITVSADGQELIEAHQPGDATGEPSTYVYRRAK